ncbi:MAG TPA: hypothetical protein VML95_12065, partial [Longimicrobiales bacterium]|nr:hypothetical protein [Longimicrobiales bacterium]
MSGRWRTAALTIVAVAAVAPFGGLAAQARPQRPQEPAQQRRALERRFHERFLDISRRRLDLEERQTERLGEILERGWRARHALQRELAAERERFQEAIGNPDTTDEEFRRRLDAMEQLRSREYELWRSEQRALAEFMTPRQRAMFVQMQMRMNDAVRDVRGRHGGRDRD